MLKKILLPAFEMDKIKQIEELIKKKCIYSKHFPKSDFQWRHHDFVRKSAVALAGKLNADVELVEVAALLHDVGRLAYGHKDHEVTSAKDAEKILRKLGYAQQFIEKVQKAILSHRGSQGPEPVTTEEKIVACADAMAHIEDAAQLFCIMTQESEIQGKKRTAAEVINIFSAKIERAWKKACRIPEAKKILQKKYGAIKLIFT